MVPVGDRLAFTVHAWWAGAIGFLGKDVENRSMRFPGSLLGERVAVHCGVGLPDPVEEALVAARIGWRDPSGVVGFVDREGVPLVPVGPGSRPPGGVVRLGAVVAEVTLAGQHRPGRGCGPWCDSGAAWHWELEGVEVVEPFPARGMPGFWSCPRPGGGGGRG